MLRAELRGIESGARVNPLHMNTYGGESDRCRQGGIRFEFPRTPSAPVGFRMAGSRTHIWDVTAIYCAGGNEVQWGGCFMLAAEFPENDV